MSGLKIPKVFKIQHKSISSDGIDPSIFHERQGSYLNELNFYLFYYKKVPNFTHEVTINCKKARLWFETYFKEEIKDKYYCKRYFTEYTLPEYDDVFYVLKDDLLVDFDTHQNIVRFLFRDTPEESIERIAKDIRKFRVRRSFDKAEIGLLIHADGLVRIANFTVSKQKLNISKNYNDDFEEIHSIILNKLKKKNSKGLVLLHGKPGTGKTSYLRYLIKKLNKQIIFLPPSMAESINHPDILALLLKNPNSVLVIEDAENILIDRERSGNSSVSALLNITDGLLSDCLNIQIICSFNTDISKLDNALLRKGRLIAKYEFKELAVEKAQRLSFELGFENIIKEPLTLTSIYNQNELQFSNQARNAIGFKH